MTERSTLYRLAGAAALVLIGIAGCGDRQAEPLAADRTDATVLHGARHGAANGAEVSKWLAGLKQATARFHRIEAAADAGWDEDLTGCMELPGTGGMGHHYANAGLIDNVPEEFAPELLVYEPQRNGRLRLVAVEFIVPFNEEEWTDDNPPSLHGIDFHRNRDFGLWVLHAWVWKHNPAGIFEDWNPNVSCAFAQ
jgi:hypothetical protein